MEEAIALTWKTMTDRLRNLRFGALASLASLVLMLILAIAFRRGWVLGGLPALILLGTWFVHREQKLLFGWEDRVLALWGASNLCMGILSQTLSNHPHSLKKSLKSMAANLPENPDFITPPEGHILAHRRLFWTRSLLQDIRFLRAAAFNLTLAVLPVSIWSVWSEGWPGLLLGLTPVCALPIMDSLMTQLKIRAWKKRLAGEKPGSDASLPDYQARLAALDWSRIPPRQQAAIRSAL
ncbi:MAG: hypothetical protein JWP91_3032 [Fibrobacteres bacterium]|nr:hypothetical protein [Fibrobacterota bacterium]